MNIENIKHFKINSKFDFILGYETNTWTTISKEALEEYKKSNLFESINYELKVFNDLGILEYIEEPKIGDKCYFWNIQDRKMDSLIEGGPYIAVLDKITDDRYEVADCPQTFRYAEKV